MSFYAAASPDPVAPDPLAGDSCLRLGPAGAERRLVLLHGWGADADDLLDLGSELVGPEVSVVALRAPLPHPGGFGRQWYDLQQPEWPQLPGARDALLLRFGALADEIPLEQTAVLGFSQGAAMALDVATGGGGGGHSGLPLAVLIACSGYPHPDWQPQPPRTSVLLTHGQQDPVVPYAASEAIERQLREVGGTVERIGFSGGHGIDPSLFPRMRTALEQGWSGRR